MLKIAYCILIHVEIYLTKTIRKTCSLEVDKKLKRLQSATTIPLPTIANDK